MSFRLKFPDADVRKIDSFCISSGTPREKRLSENISFALLVLESATRLSE